MARYTLANFRRERPDFWRDYRRFKWGTNGEGVLVSHDLTPFL